jgi:SAM-dependent methyltransferase
MRSEGNPFSIGSDVYARARPRYPEALFEWIVSHCQFREAAWDCGTGNGQAAVRLAAYFGRVQATDISAEQIAHAEQAGNVVYSVRSAEESGFGEESFDLVTVSQALHWFDFTRFWTEVARVSRQGAFFCAWGYDWLTSDAEVDNNLVLPLRKILEPFWAPNNRTLWDGYRTEDIRFPFPRIAAPELAIEERWTLDELLRYMSTWSAFRKSQEDARARDAVSDLIAGARAKLSPHALLPIRMPLKLVAGYVPDTR